MSATTHASAPTPARNECSSDSIALAVGACLDELAALVRTLAPAQYQARSSERFAHATIGGHVRHCLDHARPVLDIETRAGSPNDAEIDYDHRERGTPIESDPAAALAELTRLAELARAAADADSTQPVRVVIMPDASGRTVSLDSSLGRELAFVLSHTIHHASTIRGIAVEMGCGVPERLGYAPSTLAHQDRSRCAR